MSLGEKMISCLDDLQLVFDRAGLCDQVHIIAEAWSKVKFHKHFTLSPNTLKNSQKSNTA